MLSEHVNVLWVEPLGFIEVRLAPVPLALPPRDIGERFGNLATIRQELACLLKVTHCGRVIFQAGVVVIPLGMQRFAEIGLKCEGGGSGLPGLLPESICWLQS